MSVPHIPQDFRHVRGRTSNGAPVFLDPQPLSEGYRYEDKDYIYETKYCYQPDNHGMGAGLFVNIVSPSSFTRDSKFPVQIFIHGGFLQWGSPHGLTIQAQYVAQERSEVWVDIGYYRLSVFGFLACDEPKIDGNFGFKDQWLALQWVQDNIEKIEGDPTNVQLSGLSGGAHSIHQILPRPNLLMNIAKVLPGEGRHAGWALTTS